MSILELARHRNSTSTTLFLRQSNKLLRVYPTFRSQQKFTSIFNTQHRRISPKRSHKRGVKTHFFVIMNLATKIIYDYFYSTGQENHILSGQNITSSNTLPLGTLSHAANVLSSTATEGNADPLPHSPVQATGQIETILPFDTIRALSRAPFVETYTQPFIIPADEFFEDNPLIAASLKPATQHKYTIALESFRLSSIAMEISPMSMDQRIAIYIQERYLVNARPGQRQEMANLICMLILMYPNLRTNLGLSRRCISGWKSLQPAKSSVPFTKQIIHAISWQMLKRQNKHATTALFLSFFACLRISEALNLCWEQLALPGDVRLSSYGPDIAGINIRDAKTSRHSGALQFVKISDIEAISYLTKLRESTSQQGGKICAISYRHFFAELRKAMEQLGLSDVPFTPHSARIGKATEDYVKGVPVEQIAINGRWKSLNSLRYYLTNGRAWILNANMNVDVQANIRRSAQQMEHTFLQAM